MTDPRRVSRAGVLLLPIALILAACGGSTSATPVPTPAGGSTATPSPLATTGASTGVEASPSGPDLAIPSFDLSQLTAGLANVDSYRVVITIGGAEKYKGVVVTKPVLSRDLTIDGKTRIVVIGDEAWIGASGQPLTAAPGSMATALFATFDPTYLVAAFSGPAWAQSAINKGTEQKNGVDATHYRIDGTTAAAGFSGLPAGAVIDSWISDKGFLVGLEATGWPGGDMSIQVSGVDDPANKVERPS